ncbi:MAG: PEP-CTERM sorting domain-containing protein [Desulfobaccales bacterium]
MERRYFFMAMLLLCLLILSTPAAASPVTFSGTGANPADIQAVVDNFKAALGPLRQIRWDGVPEALSSPNAFPPDFFKASQGAVFSTPGSGFEVSANSGPGIEFGNIDPSFPALFEPFSPQKLFTAVGSNITDTIFFVRGTDTPGTVNGFGVVFTDVDLVDSTSMEFFGSGDASLGSFLVPAASGDETFSFLGVIFSAGERVARVRITSGNSADPVVMDDFIYGDPIPLPGTFLLMGTGLAGFWLRRRFMKN